MHLYKYFLHGVNEILKATVWNMGMENCCIKYASGCNLPVLLQIALGIDELITI